MPVKILNAVEAEINAFLETPGIRVQTRHVLPADPTGGWPNKIAIFYETAESDEAARVATMAQQCAGLDTLIDQARKVRGDPAYASLKNISQRELFLQSKYLLLKPDAQVVITLLTPEMAGIIGGE